MAQVSIQYQRLVGLLHAPCWFSIFTLPIHCKPRFYRARKLIAAHSHLLAYGFQILNKGSLSSCSHGKPLARCIWHAVDRSCHALTLLLDAYPAIQAQCSVEEIIIRVGEFPARPGIGAIAAPTRHPLQFGLG